MSEMAQFKLYIKSEFEERVSKILDLGVDDDKSVFNKSMNNYTTDPTIDTNAIITILQDNESN